MVDVFDQNAPRVNNKIKVIGRFETDKEGLEFIKALNPDKTITTESPPYGDGKLVFVNGDYSYFVG